MINENQLNDFVNRLKSAAGTNLQGVALYGSAASGEHSEFSDINLLCMLGELSAAALDALASAVRWWTGNRNPAPLLFAAGDLQRLTTVFPIEMLDIRRQHRMLYGADVLAKLQVPMERHRIQLEHELRTKLLFLRQHYLLASGDAPRTRHLMLDSVSNFIALFRHALIAMGEQPAGKKSEIVERLGQRTGFDAAPFVNLLQVREGTAKPDTIDAQAGFARYLAAIEKAIQVVDALPISAAAAAAP